MNTRDKVVVGAIVGAFGVKGDLRIKNFCVNASDLEKYSPLEMQKGEMLEVMTVRPITNGFAMRAKSVTSKEAADALRGQKLYASRERFAELEEDEYYQSDLLGLDIRSADGEIVGKVKAIQNFGAGDLLEVSGRGKSVFIPFTKEVVPTVDLTNRIIIIDPPEGLLD